MKQDKIIDKDEVLKMAKQAGFHIYNNCADGIVPDLERFAKLVAVAAASKEREACAKVCDAKDEIWARAGLWNPVGEYKECAAAIRARGEQHE